MPSRAGTGPSSKGQLIDMDGVGAVPVARQGGAVVAWGWDKIAPALKGIKSGFAAHLSKHCDSCKGPPKPRAHSATCFTLTSDAECCSTDDNRPEFKGPCVPVRRGGWPHTCDVRSYMLGQLSNPQFVRLKGSLGDCNEINAKLAEEDEGVISVPIGGGAFGRRQGVKTQLLDVADQAFEEKNDRYLRMQP